MFTNKENNAKTAWYYGRDPVCNNDFWKQFLAHDFKITGRKRTKESTKGSQQTIDSPLTAHNVKITNHRDLSFTPPESQNCVVGFNDMLSPGAKKSIMQI